MGPSNNSRRDVAGRDGRPVMSTGATDSLYFRQIGIPLYGVSGLFGEMATTARTAKTNARHKEFYNGQDFPTAS